MTFRRPAAAACPLLVGLLALAVVPPCAAQVPQLPYSLRTDTFRRLLFEFHFQPLGELRDLNTSPSDSLLIVLGNPSCLTKRDFPDGLRSFVEKGGAVLIATDIMTALGPLEELSDVAGVRVTGRKLILRKGKNSPIGSLPLYAGSEHCPFVEPIDSLSDIMKSKTNVLGTLATLMGTGDRPDLFRRHLAPEQPRLRVATNAPSYLERIESTLPLGIQRLARLPDLCTIDGFPAKFVNREDPLFAVGGTLGKGRVLVLADHSIFINRMILPRDNDNLEFAANCLHWLRGGVSTPMEALGAVNNPGQFVGQRTKALFWHDGIIYPSFEVPLKKVPMPPTSASEPAIVAAIDKTITKLEETNYFNRTLLEKIQDLPGGRQSVVRYAVYLLTLAAVLLLGYRFLWRARHRPELAVPLLAKALREHEPRAPLLDQRRRALLRLGNVWEMGHRLAREYFESAGVALTSASPPRVVLAVGSRWQRWRVKRRVARLWRLARGDKPAPISPIALKRWLRELDELKTALANGTLRLT